MRTTTTDPCKTHAPTLTLDAFFSCLGTAASYCPALSALELCTWHVAARPRTRTAFHMAAMP